MIPQNMTIVVAGTPINGTADNVAFTSDAIPFDDVIAWGASMWFNAAHVVTGQQPQLTIEVSNDPGADINSFDPLPGSANVNVPASWDDLTSTWLWMRFVYVPKGATGAGLKYIDLTQWV